MEPPSKLVRRRGPNKRHKRKPGLADEDTCQWCLYRKIDRYGSRLPLCLECRCIPEARAAHKQPESKYACNKNDAADNMPLVMPACMTLALPGTPEKLQVMQDRVSRGEMPFHPQDAIWNGPQNERW